MRTGLLFLIAVLPFGSGCSSLTPKPSNGLLSELTTREKARAMFGAPVATGTVDGQEYDEFREPVMIDTVTTAIPRVSDTTFRFVYDPAGRVISASADVDERVRLATPQD